jgi:hypothetical protein
MDPSNKERAKEEFETTLAGDSSKCDSEETKNCPFCELYVSEIGVKNGAYLDMLYFSIHSNLENHKLDEIPSTRKRRNSTTDIQPKMITRSVV